jgi:hypothetical protein
VNRQVGIEKVEYERVHGGYDFDERNKIAEKVLDFASSYELTIINTYLRKREEHYTYL